MLNRSLIKNFNLFKVHLFVTIFFSNSQNTKIILLFHYKSHGLLLLNFLKHIKQKYCINHFSKMYLFYKLKCIKKILFICYG